MKQTSSINTKFMMMACRLAQKGIGAVEPNPAVGAVIVKNGKIIGRGWHKKFGGPHAEINALNDCRRRGENPKGATMYVTLEPCCHFGKTGPCTDAIISAKLKKVFVATVDPWKDANTKGIKKLRKAGIEVKVGLCQREARFFNAPFLKFAAMNKTWITLKWAQTIDGKLAWKKPIDRHRWISSYESRKDAHNLRRRAGAILVGINTVLKDDPLLTPRPANGKRPVRIVLDNRLRIPLNCKLLSTINDAPVLIVTSEKTLRLKAKKTKQIIGKGAQLLGYPQKTKSNLQFLLKYLSKIGVESLLVEGGPEVISSFIKENLADEIIVYIAPEVAGEKGEADIETALEELRKDMQLYNVDTDKTGIDQKIKGFTINGLKSAGI